MLYKKSLLVVYFIYSSMHMSIYIFQFIPSLLVAMFVFHIYFYFVDKLIYIIFCFECNIIFFPENQKKNYWSGIAKSKCFKV